MKWLWIGGIGLAAAIITNSVHAQSTTGDRGAAPPPVGGGQLDSTSTPSSAKSDSMERYYPERAARKGIGGRVVLTCIVTIDGQLSECKVKSEQPPDYGFGAAALAMAHLFKMKPAMRDGKQVGGATVEIPLNFNPPN